MKFFGNASSLKVKAGARGSPSRDTTPMAIKVCIILTA
jgi:hypothetical protein